MTKKLSELFDLPDLPSTDSAENSEVLQTIAENREAIARVDEAIDKIDLALPTVRDLEASDQEMDELADLAKSKFEDLMDLGMNMDPRFGGVVFQTAGTLQDMLSQPKQLKWTRNCVWCNYSYKKPDWIIKCQKTTQMINQLLVRAWCWIVMSY